MIKYLEETYNIKSKTPSQMQELIDLRQKVAEYRKKYDKKDKEMEVSSESDKLCVGLVNVTDPESLT